MRTLIDIGIFLGVCAFSVAMATATVYPFIKLLQAIE